LYRHACVARQIFCTGPLLIMISMAHTIGGGGSQRDRGNQARVGKYLQSGDGIFLYSDFMNLEAVFSNSTVSDADATEHTSS
jgi:hypothetical protein